MKKTSTRILLVMMTLILIVAAFSITSYAATGGQETENNNSAANADTISVGQTVEGNLSASSDVDWYKFTVNSDGYISIDFEHGTVGSTSNYWCMDLYMSDATTGYGKTSGTTYWNIAGNKNYTTPNMGVKAGTYYIKVSKSSYFSNTEYSITLNFNSASNWETEVNHSYNTANEMPINTKMTGSHSYNGDVDWYKFTIPDDGYINVDFTHEILASESNYWCMDLYMSDATTGYGKTSGTTYWNIAGNKNYTTPNMGVKAGTYYIKVSKSSYWSDAEYGLKVNFTAASNWETEVNNSYSASNSILINMEKKGSLAHDSDVDWYKFTVPNNGLISIDFTHEILTYERNYWTLDLYMSDAITGYGKTSGSTYWSVIGNSNFATPNMGVEAGTYYIKISKSSYWSNAEYGLKINFTAASNWETEVNNSYSSANDLPIKTEKTGSLTYDGDVDWYKFTVPNDGFISIDFAHEILTNERNYWCLDVYMSDATAGYGKTSGRTYWNVIGNSDLTTPKMGVKAGTYYIKISKSSYWSNAEYDLKVNFTAVSNWETEVNNSYNTANDIVIGTEKNGSLTYDGDVDWYKFTVSADGFISIDFTHKNIASERKYWCFDIYTSDATTGYGKTSGRTYWDVVGNSNFTTTKMGIKAGTYYIKISKSSYWADEEYSLKVNFTADSNWETEVNNSHGTANELVIDTAKNGALIDGNDVDWFKFTLSDSRKVSIKFVHSGQASDNHLWTVELYSQNASTSLLNNSIYGNIASTSTEYVELQAGTYYVKVSPKKTYNAVYTIQIEEYHDHVGTWVTTTETTCTENGASERVCTKCGHIDYQTHEAQGHVFGEELVTKKSGMFKKGEKVKICAVCGERETRTTASKIWILPIIIVGVAAVAFGIFNYIKVLKKKEET